MMKALFKSAPHQNSSESRLPSCHGESMGKDRRMAEEGGKPKELGTLYRTRFSEQWDWAIGQWMALERCRTNIYRTVDFDGDYFRRIGKHTNAIDLKYTICWITTVNIITKPLQSITREQARNSSSMDEARGLGRLGRASQLVHR